MTPAPVEILVVDDTPPNLLALQAVLQLPDVTVVRAASGAQALALVQAHAYAVAILDVQMPEMDGFELARRIRDSERHRSTPIIFLTAFEIDPPQVRRAYATGAVDFVVKPFDPEILRSKVSVFVDLFRKSREAAQRARVERERDEANAREVELKRMDRLKDEFLATLAHELRNPLMSLLSATELLGQRPVADPILADLHGLIRRQVGHLRRLVEDSLEISRFTQGKIEVRPEIIDLREAIDRAIELSQAAIDSRGIDLVVSLPPQPIPITGDLLRLAQVVSNLLDNAAKFSPPGGKVLVSLDATHGEAVIRVRDSGRGIPPDRLAQIFEPFVQSQTGDSSRGGLGIGLALVKQLVLLHGGRVSAASDGIGHGAELVVTLPLDQRIQRVQKLQKTAPETAPVASSAAQPATSRVHVLVVDDNPEIRSTVQVFLQIEGHFVTTADCGRAALDQITRADPDVVLLDIGLPDLDGYAVARQVRATHRTSRPRLIAMTGNVGARERERALRAGFDAHVPKPIDGRALLRVVADQ